MPYSQVLLMHEEAAKKDFELKVCIKDFIKLNYFDM